VPTTPAHQQPMVEIVTCPSRVRAERVPSAGASQASLLGVP
jgi:hypothetical protein